MKLAYATRQFDVAMDLYEKMLMGNTLSASDLDLGGYLDDYLELAIRVRREHEHLSQVQHLAEQAIRMAGKARIDSESERDSHTAEVARLQEENKALREKLVSAGIDTGVDEQLQPAQEDEML